jgi:RimJ/RimL family protein N-acetyltransferase
MDSPLVLLPIHPDGKVDISASDLPEIAAGVIGATTRLYRAVGFEEPWIGYFALRESTVVGTCSFKSPPVNNRVEIAYFTFPEFEGAGVATAMARALVKIAQECAQDLVVAAQTLAERNASHRILEKLGFSHVESIMDPEDGAIWEWQLL